MSFALGLLFPLFVLFGSEFPSPYNSEPLQSNPLSPAEFAERLQLPPGFQATVFAAEPDVQNPIALAWDARGRLWIAENYTYAERALKFDLNLRDRILIFEDTNGDGQFDSRKIFTDDLQMLTSIEIGLGGVWATCPPHLIFIPDHDANDAPDGAPEVVLDGFTVPSENYHNFVNGLRFGPDGWLYGRCGASSPGELGPPGTPDGERIPMRGTIWRYHPRRRVVEALSSGTTNPWGHDWNEHGELFFINTVNGHLWHHFVGAHFMRPHTIDPNPRVYRLIDQHADHWHFDTQEGWSQQRDGKANAYGGGHAHVGMMIYLGANWPNEYRGQLFTINMHGLRVNQEILERRGSGYAGRHGPDLFVASDPWFRGMELSYGPDGGVFLIDWSDAGECHESTGVHRTSGRIYKISYNQPQHPAQLTTGTLQGSASDRQEAKALGELDPLASLDLTRLEHAELAALFTHPNEWFPRQARLELARRANHGANLTEASDVLSEIFVSNPDPVAKLRALWTLYALDATKHSFLRDQLDHPNEHVRAWAIRLLTDSWPLDTVLSQRPSLPRAAKELDSPEQSQSQISNSRSEMENAFAPEQAEFIRLAKSDSSALVRLALASTLQRLPISHRVNLATALVARSEDAEDHNLPLLIWYGLIPLADEDPGALPPIAAQCQLPLTRLLIARRLTEEIETNPAPLNHLLRIAQSKTESFQADILQGMAEALSGWSKATQPEAWAGLARAVAESEHAALRDRVREMSVVFGDGRALDEVKRIALDHSADLPARKAALQTLIDHRPSDLRQLCEQLLNVRFLNPIAARGLASFEDPEIGVKLARAFRQFHPSERPQLMSTLVSRPSFGLALLNAVAENRIPRSEITPFHARQLRSLNHAQLNERLVEVWGEFRSSDTDKQKLIARWKESLTPEALARADKSRGREVYNLSCASCHTLYGRGGKIGPDLTGSGRDNLDYLLENTVDPSAVVTADYRMWIARLEDGRILNGIVTAQTGQTVTLQTMTETLTIDRKHLRGLESSSVSLMPEDLLEALEPDHARDLIAYLMHKTQVPLINQK